MAGYARHWVFTLNNYTPADELRIQAIECDYVCYGREVGANGTPHLQGMISFSKRMRFAAVKTKIGSNPHIEVCMNLTASSDYCKKDNNFYESGSIPEGPGTRTDLNSFKQDVKAGMLSMAELREKHSSIVARYYRFVNDYVNDHKTVAKCEKFPLREWQQLLYLKLARAADSRKIIFLVDCQGNQGKSWFARYYCELHDDAQLILPGKKADMSFCVKTSTRVLLLDCPRSKQGDFIQYDFLEEIKNGIIFSPKYESQMKYMEKKVHVVVFMNESPDMTKLSSDRYEVCWLS